MNDIDITMKININSDLQRKFNEFCKEINITAEEFLSNLIKKIVTEKQIPSKENIVDEVALYNEETKKAIRDAHNGINLSKAFTSVDELFKDLYADD